VDLDPTPPLCKIKKKKIKRAEETGRTAEKNHLANFFIYVCNEKIRNLEGGDTVAHVEKYVIEGNGEQALERWKVPVCLKSKYNRDLGE
jgi:hypothetical protein